MIGAEMRATGNMGEMNRSVWREGSIAGTGRVAEAVTGSALQAAKSLDANFTLNMTVDGRSFSMQINSNTTPDDMARLFREAGLGENVAGMVGNAMRSHIMSGGYETRAPLQVTINT